MKVKSVHPPMKSFHHYSSPCLYKNFPKFLPLMFDHQNIHMFVSSSVQNLYSKWCFQIWLWIWTLIMVINEGWIIYQISLTSCTGPVHGYCPLMKEGPIPTFGPFSCTWSSWLEWTPTLEWALCGVWKAQLQALCTSEVKKFAHNFTEGIFAYR